VCENTGRSQGTDCFGTANRLTPEELDHPRQIRAGDLADKQVKGFSAVA
jgi:hypothetical protein